MRSLMKSPHAADAKSQIKLAAYTILSETDQAHLSDYEFAVIFDSPFCIF